MKTSKYPVLKTIALCVVLLAAARTGKAQIFPNSYINVDWQMGVPLGSSRRAWNTISPELMPGGLRILRNPSMKGLLPEGAAAKERAANSSGFSSKRGARSACILCRDA